MKTAKALLAVLLLFLCGVVFGAMNGAKWMERRFQSRMAEGPPAIGEMVTRRLARSLTLRPEQGDQVHAIVLETQRKLSALRARQEPEVRQIVRDAQTSIRAQLSAEQAGEFDRLVERSKEVWLQPNP